MLAVSMNGDHGDGDMNTNGNGNGERHYRRRAAKRHISDLPGLTLSPYLRVSRADKADKEQLDAERSTSTQRRIYEENRSRFGMRPGIEYADPDMSASRFASKRNRPDFERMVADVQAGKHDGQALWFWEIERQQRRLDVFARLRDVCRDHGVLWIIRDQIADPANPDDMLMFGLKSMMAEGESEKLSVRVYDGKESAAHKGRPPGRIPYGYKRVYDPDTREWVRDDPDVFNDDSRPVEASPAWVVTEIFTRLAAGHSVKSIRKDLNARGIPTRHGAEWGDAQINYIAQNPTYIARRFHQAGQWVQCADGKERLRGHMADRRNRIIDAEVNWLPLVDDATFWAVQQIYAQRSSAPKRPGRARHLLSQVARCGKCGSYLQGHHARGGQSGPVYQCNGNYCVGIYEHVLDPYVEKVIVGFLSDPEVYADLTKTGDSAIAVQARADADQARVELEKWRQLAERGEIDPVDFARAAKGARARIEEADKRAQAATVDSRLEGVLGPQAEEKWATFDMAVKRQIITLVADIRVHPVGRGRGRARNRDGNGKFTTTRGNVADRVTISSLLGPGTGQQLTG
jgi:site-specific DNA recombinase